MNIEESILDFPKNGLNPSIWRRNPDNTYSLTSNARYVVATIVNWVRVTFNIPDLNVRIVGSITSNSYSSKSDIDIHFSSKAFNRQNVDEFNSLLRKRFEEFIAENPQFASIDGVKTEVYIQPNPYQDLMSVGCYDFNEDTWLVGPDIKAIDYDPFAEYFMKDMRSVDDIIDNVRSIILQIYELSIGTLKTQDAEQRQKIGNKLMASLKKGAALFNKLKKRRKHKSSPKNAEQALQNREDEGWKLVDSAFKLLDKFGYLKILWQAARSIETDEVPEQAANNMLQMISDKISMQSLDDSEKTLRQALLELEQCDESLSSMLRLSAVAALMSISSLLPAAALAKEMSKAKHKADAAGQTLTKDSMLMKTAIDNAATENEQIGPMSKTNVVNAVAQTLWKEGRGEGIDGIKAIASVLLNRTGDDPSYLVAVLKEPDAFSCHKGYTGGWTDGTYRWFIPWKDFQQDMATNKPIWDTCNQIALQLVDKKFKSTIGNMNSYLNKKKAKKSAVDSWGKKCTKQIGRHHFGYLPEHDPKFVKPGTMVTWKKINKGKKPSSQTIAKKTIVKKPILMNVQKGDTLSKIAKKHNITVKDLLKLNPELKNPDMLSIGQTIRIA